MQHLYPFKMCIIHNFFAGGVSPQPGSAISPYFIIRPLLRRSIHLYLNHSLFTILYSLRRVAAAGLRNLAVFHYPTALAAKHTLIPQLFTLHYSLFTKTARGGAVAPPRAGEYILLLGAQQEHFLAGQIFERFVLIMKQQAYGIGHYYDYIHL